MASRPPLPHDQIVAYLRGKSDKGTHLQILQLRKDDPTYQALFELIDEFKAQANLEERIETGNIPATFSAVEELLLRLYSGAAGGETTRQFIGGLLQSPVFYQRLWAKLAAIDPQTTPKEVLNPKQMLTEDKILTRIKKAAKSRAPVSDMISRSVPSLTKAAEPVFVFLKRIPNFAYVLPLLLVGTIGILQIANRNNFDKIYAYDIAVPVPPPSGLRGPTDYSQVDSIFYSFESRFQLAMSDYMRRDYQATITALEDLAPFVRMLQTSPDRAGFLPPRREYYFYLGVSHFGLSRSRKFKFAPGEKERHQEQAIQFLAHADSLAQAQRMSANDRETFFLGLAYGFAGRHAEAVAQLNKIPANSSYYEKIAKPIAKWQSHKP
jgi:hypothetical protein